MGVNISKSETDKSNEEFKRIINQKGFASLDHWKEFFAIFDTQDLVDEDDPTAVIFKMVPSIFERVWNWKEAWGNLSEYKEIYLLGI